MTDKPREPMKIERDTVRVKPHTYQPTKAEAEAEIDIRNPDGSSPTFRQFVSRVLRPINMIEDPDA